jgi:hypothetical protein
MNLNNAIFIAKNIPPSVALEAVKNATMSTQTPESNKLEPQKLSQKHIESLIPPEVAKIFPWAPLQEKAASTVSGRIRAWNACLQELHRSLDTILALENAQAIEYARLASVFTVDAREVAGSSQHMNTVRDSIERLSQEHAFMVDFMKKTSQPRIAKALKSWQTFSKQIVDGMDNEFAHVEKTRLAGVQAIQAHAVMNLQKGTSPVEQDAWIVEQTLRNVLGRALVAEEQYGKTMNNINVKFASQEAVVIEELKTLFGEFRAMGNKKMANLSNHYDLLSTFVSGLASNAPWDEFNGRHKVTDPQLWMDPRKISSLPVKLNLSTNAIKEGQLQVLRPGRFWSTTWKDVYCVITDSGWFHAFDNSKSVFSSVLNSAQAAMSGQAVAFSKRKYEQLDNLETLFSIPLSNSNRVFAGIPAGHETDKIAQAQQEHMFEIIYLERGIGARDDPPVPGAATQPGETRYQLKAPSEEEMVDWIVMFQQVLREKPKKPVQVITDAMDLVSGRMNDRDVFAASLNAPQASDLQLEAMHSILDTAQQPTEAVDTEWANFETLSLTSPTTQPAQSFAAFEETEWNAFPEENSTNLLE